MPSRIHMKKILYRNSKITLLEKNVTKKFCLPNLLRTAFFLEFDQTKNVPDISLQCCVSMLSHHRILGPCPTYVTVHSSKLKMYVHILMHHQISLESILYCFQAISTFTVNNLRRNRFTIGKVLPCGLVGHRKVARRPLQNL